MNFFMLIGGLLALFTAAVHLIGGGREIAKPLLTNEALPEPVKLTMYACWHFVSIFLLISGVVLCAGSATAYFAEQIFIAIAMMYFIMSGIFLVITLFVTENKGLFTYPQWTLLLPIGIFCTLGVM